MDLRSGSFCCEGVRPSPLACGLLGLGGLKGLGGAGFVQVPSFAARLGARFSEGFRFLPYPLNLVRSCARHEGPQVPRGQKIVRIKADSVSKWCPGWDSNPHAFRHRFLRPTCLPFHHPGKREHTIAQNLLEVETDCDCALELVVNIVSCGLTLR